MVKNILKWKSGVSMSARRGYAEVREESARRGAGALVRCFQWSFQDGLGLAPGAGTHGRLSPLPRALGFSPLYKIPHLPGAKSPLCGAARWRARRCSGRPQSERRAAAVPVPPGGGQGRRLLATERRVKVARGSQVSGSQVGSPAPGGRWWPLGPERSRRGRPPPVWLRSPRALLQPLPLLPKNKRLPKLSFALQLGKKPAVYSLRWYPPSQRFECCVAVCWVRWCTVTLACRLETSLWVVPAPKN